MNELQQPEWSGGSNQPVGGQGRKKLPERARKRKEAQKEREVVRELQDKMKHNNIRIIWIPEGEEEQQGIEKLFKKVMVEKFL